MAQTAPGGEKEPRGSGESMTPARVPEAADLPVEPARAAPPGRARGDLRGSLEGLSRLALAGRELEEVLTEVAQFAAAAIPGADGAGLTLLEGGRPDTIVASAPFVAEVDAIQYSVLEGPCITAARERRTVRSGLLSEDSQWPRFGPPAGGLGVNSVLSLPLVRPDGVVGAMDVYAHPPNAFTDRAADIGERFAEMAAVAVQNAQALAHARRLAAQLEAALNSRAVIDQALGILMSRMGGSPDEAFDRLRERSQADNVKLREVAQRVVDEAVRRARARHAGS